MIYLNSLPIPSRQSVGVPEWAVWGEGAGLFRADRPLLERGDLAPKHLPCGILHCFGAGFWQLGAVLWPQAGVLLHVEHAFQSSRDVHYLDGE